MSHYGFKSLHLGLLPDEENGKCGTARCCAEFPSIGSHSPKRKRTQGGLSDWRHSRHKWKLEQNIIAGVVIVGMVVNALVTEGGLMLSCPKLVYILHGSGSMELVDGQQVAEV